MKKGFLFVSLFVLFIACAAPPTNRDATTTTRSSTNSAAPAPAPISEAEVIAKEKGVWETIKSKDYEAFAALLADDQLEVSQSGVWDKAGTIANVKTYEFTEVNFADWKVLNVDPDLVVTTYTLSLKGKQNGKDFPPGDYRASSAWVNRNGKWLAIYYQECGVEKMPAPPPGSPSPMANTSPMAAATPPALTSDPIANEKLVWDLFRAKKYDAFAAVLDQNVLEVNPHGVFKKEEIIPGVQTFDATKAELSEFKSVNIDKDSALVTYLVKISGEKPETERHSTIWVNRDGKWMVAFHHGTPVKSNP
jgi:hypothetical protein